MAALSPFALTLQVPVHCFSPICTNTMVQPGPLTASHMHRQEQLADPTATLPHPRTPSPSRAVRCPAGPPLSPRHSQSAGPMGGLAGAAQVVMMTNNLIRKVTSTRAQANGAGANNAAHPHRINSFGGK